MTTDLAAASDAAVKAKHRAMWASGDYPALASDLIADLGPALVAACGVRPGMRVLDVAAGRAAAAERGVELTWREADAEALPFADAAFQLVTAVRA
jgi:ubiquinone/menaquinone biosynthesis C-methylase UbiE